jgi:hypothetical protein
MQGKLIIGAFLAAGLGSAAVAGDQVRRQACQKAEQPQQVQQPQQRQPQPQQQPQRNKPQGCAVTRMVPSVVDPTPTFLL